MCARNRTTGTSLPTPACPEHIHILKRSTRPWLCTLAGRCTRRKRPQGLGGRQPKRRLLWRNCRRLENRVPACGRERSRRTSWEHFSIQISVVREVLFKVANIHRRPSTLIALQTMRVPAQATVGLGRGWSHVHGIHGSMWVVPKRA